MDVQYQSYINGATLTFQGMGLEILVKTYLIYKFRNLKVFQILGMQFHSLEMLKIQNIHIVVCS